MLWGRAFHTWTSTNRKHSYTGTQYNDSLVQSLLKKLLCIKLGQWREG